MSICLKLIFLQKIEIIDDDEEDGGTSDFEQMQTLLEYKVKYPGRGGDGNELWD